MTEAATVTLAEAAVRTSTSTPRLTEVALVLPHELGDVRSIVSRIPVTHRDRDVWAYLVPTWALERTPDPAERLEIVEWIFAELDYPASMSPLIRWMPADGRSPRDQQRREAEFLLEASLHFQSRRHDVGRIRH